MNYFEFYGLPVSFQPDTSALRRQYLSNSKQYHPDFHTQSDEAEQARMLELSTLNNEAFRVLSDADQRMQYVLKIKGFLGDETSHPPLPQDFLLEMMDINENMMELEFNNDAVRFELIRRAVDHFRQELDVGIQPVVETWTEADGVEALTAVRDYFLKKRYLLRIQENLSTFAPHQD